MAKRWTEEDIDALKVYFENDYDDEEIAEALGFTYVGTVSKKRRELKLFRRTRESIWDDRRLGTLLDPANRGRSNVEIGMQLHLDPSTVYKKRKELGLPTSTLRRWTQEEIQLLRDHYPAKGLAYVAKLVGREQKAVEYKAGVLGVRREGRFSRGRD